MSEKFPISQARSPLRATNVGPNTPAESAAQARAPLRATNVGPDTPARVFAVDPGQRKGCAVYSGGKRARYVKDFASFVRTLESGDIVVTETTAHLYKPSDRDLVLRTASNAGVRILGMRSIFTSRFRVKEKKSDLRDARRIFEAYSQKPQLFSRMKVSVEVDRLTEARTECTLRLVELRREGYPGFSGHKEATLSVLAEYAAVRGWGWRRLDRLSGFYASGYPSLSRSNRNKHGVGKKFEGKGRSRTTTPKQKAEMQGWRRLLKQKFRTQAPLPLRATNVGPYTPASEEVFV